MRLVPCGKAAVKSLSWRMTWPSTASMTMRSMCCSSGAALPPSAAALLGAAASLGSSCLARSSWTASPVTTPKEKSGQAPPFCCTAHDPLTYEHRILCHQHDCWAAALPLQQTLRFHCSRPLFDISTNEIFSLTPIADWFWKCRNIWWEWPQGACSPERQYSRKLRKGLSESCTAALMHRGGHRRDASVPSSSAAFSLGPSL